MDTEEFAGLALTRLIPTGTNYSNFSMSSISSSITVTNAAEQKPPFILGICRKLKLNIVASPIEYCEQHLFMNFTGCLIHDMLFYVC